MCRSPTNTLAQQPEVRPQRQFGRDKRTTLPRQCLECPVRWACNGCPKDRIATTPDGEPGLNYLCAGYYHFFTHAWPTMDTIGRLLQAGRPPSDIMAGRPIDEQAHGTAPRKGDGLG